MAERKKNDPERITAFLRLLFRPGEVFEIRVLDGERPGRHYPRVESGYFDWSHIDDVPPALAEITSALGQYVTMNPVNPALLNRGVNRLRTPRRGETTSDTDTVRRRSLLVDIDPVRPAGISATDGEKAHALAKAVQISDWLTSVGWPRPIIVDSGNGYYLLYLIDLPADDGGLVHRCLQALQPAADAYVHVDASVANASRICRLPGTWNCKGDHSPERPHRMAEVVEAPAAPEIAPVALLEALAATLAPAPHAPAGASPAPPAADGGRPGDDYNRRGELVALLEAHGWQRVGGNGDNQHWRRPGKTTGRNSATFDGRTFYVFSSNASPFEPNQGYSPFAVFALLEHSGDFTAAAAALAARNYGDATRDDADVDLTALLERLVPEEDDEDRDPGNPGRMPARLYRVPGFLDAYQSWVLSTAPYPSAEATFAGGLTMLSWLTGRKVRTVGGIRGNLYVGVIAEAGVGKNRPREANAALMRSLDAQRCLAENIASAEALEDALRAEPCLLWQCDEFDSLLASMSKDDGSNGGRWAALSAAMRAIYTSSATLYPCRRRARLRGRDQEIETIDQPHLVALATATPEAFFDALSEGQAVNGLLSRCMLLDAPGEERRSQRAQDLADVPADVLTPAAAWVAWSPGGNLNNEYPRPAVVPASEVAQQLLDQYREDCDRRYREAAGTTAAVERAILARAPAMAEKLALLYGASAAAPPATLPQIDTPAVEWGRDVAEYFLRRMLWHVHRYLADGPFARAQKRLLRYLDDQGGQASRRDIARHMRSIPDRTFEEVLKSLLRQERIAECDIQGRRKSVAGWRKLP